MLPARPPLFLSTYCRNFEVLIPALAPAGGQLMLTVCDKDRFSRDDSLGQCFLDLGQLWQDGLHPTSRRIETSLPLQVLKEVPHRAPYDTRRRMDSVESGQEAPGRAAKLDKATEEVTGEVDVVLTPMPLSRSAALQVEWQTKKKKWVSYWLVLVPAGEQSAGESTAAVARGSVVDTTFTDRVQYAPKGCVVHLLGSLLEPSTSEQAVVLNEGEVKNVEVEVGQDAEGREMRTVEIVRMGDAKPLRLRTTEGGGRVTKFTQALMWATGLTGSSYM